MRFELKRQPSGPLAVRDREFGETMHPGGGPWAEANGLYVAGAGLPTLLTGTPNPAAAGPLVVFDVGLGAGANALAAIARREELARRGGSPRPLAVISFEADPEALRFALAHAGQLGYLLGHEAKVEALLRDGRWEEPEALIWEVRWGDFPRLIGEEPQRADAIFFDPFSPRVNPDMWSVPTLEATYRCRRPGAATRLFTYSTALGVRAALLLAGFFVGAGGIVTHVFGRVRDRRGRPIAGARIEIWQVDALGRYIHSGDARRGPRDTNFQGFGRAVSEADGGYRFRTIKPVPYPGRTPHIHFAVRAGNFRRLITQMYIAGEPLNETDMLLRRVRDPAERRALIVPLTPVPAIEADALGGRFDIVLADG